MGWGRAWAEVNGHDVPGRGRVPAAVRDAHDKAHLLAHAPALLPVIGGLVGVNEVGEG